MATIKTAFKPPVETLENSMTSVRAGQITRHSAPWNIEDSWLGTELGRANFLRSMWAKAWVVRFYGGSTDKPDFILYLDINTPEELVKFQMDIWRTALNNKRVQ